MFDVFVREALAVRALCQADTFAEGSVVRFAVVCVELRNWGAAFYADGHLLVTRSFVESWECGAGCEMELGTLSG